MVNQTAMMIILLLAAASVTAYLSIYSRRRKDSLGALPFSLMMTFVTLWSLGTALELGGSDFALKLAGVRVAYVGIVGVPVTWLIFAITYSGRERWINWRSLIVLAIEPVLVLALVLTDVGCGWYWTSLRIDPGTSSLIGEHTLLFWIHATYSYLLLLAGFYLLIKTTISYYHLYRGQAIAMMIGALLPWIGNALFLFDRSPVTHLDLTPFAFTFTGIFVGWAIFRLRLLEIVPVARDAIIDSMSDPVIVMDRRNRVVDLNPSAQRILGRASSEVIGLTVKEALTNWPELVERFHDVMEEETEIVIEGRDGVKHNFDLRLAPVRNRQGQITGRFVVLRDISEQKSLDNLQRSLGTLQSAMEELVQAIALIVEMRDPYTAGHERRVAQLACAIAQEMGMTDEQVGQIKMASVIHDVGKIYIPTEILNKPGRLTDIEFRMIKAHAQVGYDILKTINFSWPLAQVVRQHHERLDGSGYPDGLAGDAIMLEARIISVADVAEAMSSHRPYRAALGIEKALEELKAKSGVFYDPQVVEACIKLFSKGFMFEQ